MDKIDYNILPKTWILYYHSSLCNNSILKYYYIKISHKYIRCLIYHYISDYKALENNLGFILFKPQYLTKKAIIKSHLKCNTLFHLSKSSINLSCFQFLINFHRSNLRTSSMLKGLYINWYPFCL